MVFVLMKNIYERKGVPPFHGFVGRGRHLTQGYRKAFSLNHNIVYQLHIYSICVISNP